MKNSQVLFQKILVNRCWFPKFKFIKCGSVEIFLITELDHNDFCFIQKGYCSLCCFSAGVTCCLGDRLMNGSSFFFHYFLPAL